MIYRGFFFGKGNVGPGKKNKPAAQAAGADYFIPNIKKKLI